MTVGMAKVMAREGLFWVWVDGACHQGLPEGQTSSKVEEDVPEILFIGNVQNKEALEGW